MLNIDPLFAPGPEGDFYLSQINAGQALDSPCINAGDNYSHNICFEMPWLICMDELTTRTDEITDSEIIDMGVHYIPSAYMTPTPVPTPTPTFFPRESNNFMGNEDCDVDAADSEGYRYRSNNYYGSATYHFKNETEYHLDTAYSYWGEDTTNEMAAENVWPVASSNIEAIYDFNDDAAMGFVDFGYWRSEPEVSAPGHLWSVNLNPPSPVGAEIVIFTLTFSRPMDTNYEPAVTFGQDEPYDEHEITGGIWDTDQTWAGSFDIDYFTGDGENYIRISGARDPEGMEMPLDVSHSFIIETGIGGVEGVTSQALDEAVIISWAPHPDEDLDGYKLHYGLESGNYNGVDAAEGPSPIDAGDVNIFTLTGLTNDQWYFMSIQAYDVRDNQGPLSSEVAAMPQETGATPPATFTPTMTPTATLSPTMTPTRTSTVSPSPTLTATSTRTHTNSPSPVSTYSPVFSPTQAPDETPSPTPTSTYPSIPSSRNIGLVLMILCLGLVVRLYLSNEDSS